MQELKATAATDNLSPNRTYKSKLFIMIFSQKKELLELYNAVNGSHYTNPEKLEVNTLENAVYMSMQNDISFVIDSRMMLYEHQSTYCPNIPLRNLFYVSDLYSAMTKGDNLYGKKQIMVPTPRFFVFYNGVEELPEVMQMKLSEAYEVGEVNPSLELMVTWLNINLGKNQKLLDACRTLRDYAIYTDRVRKYTQFISLEAAVERAITECIKEDVLAEFLTKNRAEARKVSIYEYDAERQRMFDREEGREEGKQEQLIEKVCKKLKRGKSVEIIAEELEEKVEVILEICEVAKESAPEYDSREVCNKMIKRYW